uniref:F-box protein At3g54460 n=1 Tax=Rhizophora mucronata TaxID=61149 RepID=A0A2P2INB3_RHIMU
MEAEDNPFPDHKLCGYTCAVLTAPAPDLPSTAALSFLCPCHVVSDGGKDFQFKADNGVVLSPLVANRNDAAFPAPDADNGGKKRTRRRRSLRGIGMVNGSVSVVHQILTLLAHRCVEVSARVLHVDRGEEEEKEARVVVLLDVFLPIALWSGWQFPKSGAIAGALFRHLSCDWEKRSLLQTDIGEYFRSINGGYRIIWNLPDCHAIDCKLHCDAPDSSRKMQFELHEIFNSLPSLYEEKNYTSRVSPSENSHGPGICDLTDDILMTILSDLKPMDLVRVAATCRHLKSLALLIMPCMKLKLFPHQQAAVEWMLQREQNPRVLPHPLYMKFSTEDGFTFHVNSICGEIVVGKDPTIRDFRGGMFCDEPGLGKTVTALSLILKTQGTLASPPEGVQISWCIHNGDQRCGYYEDSADSFRCGNKTLGKRIMNQGACRGQLSMDQHMHFDPSQSSPKRARILDPREQIVGSNEMWPAIGRKSLPTSHSEPVARVVRCTRRLSCIKKNLLNSYEEESVLGNKKKGGEDSTKRKRSSSASKYLPWGKRLDKPCGQVTADYLVYNENWVQCDACGKWRKLKETVADATAAWFCSMNIDPEHRSCKDAEEAWDSCETVTYLPGFYTKGTSGGKQENVSFFISVLKDYYSMMESKTKRALMWLAKLSPEKLSQMETTGLVGPVLAPYVSDVGHAYGFHKIFQAFGLVRKVERGISKWYYPKSLINLEFDLAALRIALCEPLNLARFYLSRATLIVVPANLVDHWKTQILRHVERGQLRFCIWTGHRKLSAHNLAWDYDIVITTFNRLSAEWDLRKKSPLKQVHWIRVMLDEGHTLGSSLNLTNKLQMATSLAATNRWLLTGTPTSNTPDSQLSHLHPMLMFLHEEVYGSNHKYWEAGILRPFEANIEEGRTRLVQLLQRCLISARKVDLKTIPPCIKKVTFLSFTEGHARSYNELVATVRRNILMADWNDPDHIESLLNRKQWKFRTATLRNVRLSCCVAGHIKMEDVAHDIQETMDMLVGRGLDPISEEYALIKYNLQFGGNCLRCKEWCRLPIITPCRHLLCLDCVALDREKCTLHGCGKLYEMQIPDTIARAENPKPKWPVPKDLIELQPSYKQDEWDPDWESTSSCKVAYLVQRLKALQEATIGSVYSVDGGSEVNSIDKQLHFFQSDSEGLLENCSRQSSESNTASEKVIIFSQFLEHINAIKKQLTLAGIKFAELYSPLHASKKIKSLSEFLDDPTCMAILMDGSAALGLDFSFVTHVFLMEPIWDRSMEEQVISRAHRMGATRPILVETLAMRGTVEEQMLAFLQDPDERRRILKEGTGKPDTEGARPHRSVHDLAETDYLAQLSFVRTSSRT